MISPGMVLGLMQHLKPTRAADVTERARCMQLAMEYGRGPAAQTQVPVEQLYAHTLTFADTVYLVDKANTHVTMCVVVLMIVASLFLIITYKCFQIYASESGYLFRSNYPVMAGILAVFVFGVAYLLVRAKKSTATPTPVFMPTTDTTVMATQSAMPTMPTMPTMLT